MGTCPDAIKRLIDRFNQQSDQIRSPDYNETLIRIDFINPLMSELGWDIDNHQGFAEQYREVVHEDRVKADIKNNSEPAWAVLPAITFSRG
jgi:predicted type IV restriction endonuclease